MEVTAKNVDRLVTTEMRWGSRGDRGIIAPLYECAFKKLGNRSPSLVAAQRLIEEDVRRITPYADGCRCPCGAGLACVVRADIVFPAAISNWGAYGIVAMLAFLLKKPEVLQDSDTERRILEACITAGAVDGIIHSPVMSVDSVGHETYEALITMLHSIIRNALFKSED